MTTDETAKAEAQKKVLNRLRRAQGQLNAVIKQVESGAGCREVITQLSACSSALDKAGYLVIASALRDCLASDDDQADLSPAEVERLFLSLA